MFSKPSTLNQETESLLKERLLSWQNTNVKNSSESFVYFFNASEYSLKMLWQARLSKLNDKDRTLNIWITENYLPDEYKELFNKNDINKPQLINLDKSHDSIAFIVLNNLWNDYLNSSFETKPPEEKISFFKKLFR